MALSIKVILKDGASKGFKKLGGGVKSLAKSFTGLGAAVSVVGMVALATKSLKAFSELSSGIREIGTLMGGLTGKQMKAMEQGFQSIAISSGVATKELTGAQYDIVSAGFDKISESTMVLDASMKLAVGGITDAKNAADLMTTTLNAYNLAAEDSVDVSDTLFTIVKLGKTTMTELGSSFGRVLPLANAANISLDAVGAAMATITAKGIKTAEATTGLRAAIQALSAPTDVAKKEMDKAGISVIKFADGTVDLVKTMKQFAGLDPDAIRKFIPSVEAGTAIISMAGSIDLLATNLGKFGDKAGAADEAFQFMQDGVAQKLSKLKQASEATFQALGSAIFDVLEPKIDAINDLFATIGQIGFGKTSEIMVAVFDDVMEAVKNSVAAKMAVIGKTISIHLEAAFRPFKDVEDLLGGKAGEELQGLKDDAEEANKALTDTFKKVGEILEAEGKRQAAIRVDAFKESAEEQAKAFQESLVIPVLKMQGDMNSAYLVGVEEVTVAAVEMQEKTIGQMASGAQKGMEAINRAVNQVAAVFDAAAELRQTNIDNEKNTAITAAEDERAAKIASINASSQNELDKAANIAAAEAKFKTKTMAIERKAAKQEEALAKKQKAVKISQAISGTALAVINGLQTKPFIPLGIIAGAAAAAAGAFQIATIAKQKFATGGIASSVGGMVQGRMGVDQIPISVSRGEAVISKPVVDEFGEANMDRFAKTGQMPGGGGGSTIIVVAPDSEILRVIEGNPAAIAAINEKARRLRMQ